MGEAYYCDRCDEFFKGAPYGVIKRFEEGRYSENDGEGEYCKDCYRYIGEIMQGNHR